MRFAELVSHRIFERKWRSREILRAHLFEGPFIRLNFGFVCELWHFVAYFGTKQTSQCWVDRLLLTYWNALWCVRVCGKSGYLKYRGSGWRGAVLVIAIRTVAITSVCVWSWSCMCESWFDVYGSSGGTLEVARVTLSSTTGK